MLRVLTRIFIFLAGASAIAAMAGSLVKPDQQEIDEAKKNAESVIKRAQDPAFIEEQKKNLQKALQDAQKLRQDKKFQEMMNEELEAAKNIPDIKGKFYFNQPKLLTQEQNKQFMQEGMNLNLSKYKGEQARRDKPIVLVSLSMPEEELERLILEFGRVGGTLVLRGIIEDSLEKTVKHLSAMMLKLRDKHKDKKLAGFNLDPTVFERFEVDNAVPVFVLPMDEIRECISNNECATPRYVKASGSVTLSYFLETVLRTSQDSEEKQVAQYWLDQLGGKS